jgi:Flp pilus assembly protein protease CpaA
MDELSVKGILMPAIVAAVLLAATATDLRHHRIPNGLCGILLLAGSLNRLGCWWLAGFEGHRQAPMTELFALCVSIVVPGLLPLTLYVMSAGGAGDVKLSWGLGACLGAWEGLVVVSAGYFMGGVFSMMMVSFECAAAALPACFGRGDSVAGAVSSAWTRCSRRSLPMAPFMLAGYACLLAAGRPEPAW